MFNWDEGNARGGVSATASDPRSASTVPLGCKLEWSEYVKAWLPA